MSQITAKISSSDAYFEVVEGALGSKAAWTWLEAQEEGNVEFRFKLGAGVEVGPMCCEHWTVATERERPWQRSTRQKVVSRLGVVGECGVGKRARSRHDAGKSAHSSDFLTIWATDEGRQNSQSSLTGIWPDTVCWHRSYRRGEH